MYPIYEHIVIIYKSNYQFKHMVLSCTVCGVLVCILYFSFARIGACTCHLNPPWDLICSCISIHGGCKILYIYSQNDICAAIWIHWKWNMKTSIDVNRRAYSDTHTHTGINRKAVFLMEKREGKKDYKWCEGVITRTAVTDTEKFSQRIERDCLGGAMREKERGKGAVRCYTWFLLLPPCAVPLLRVPNICNFGSVTCLCKTHQYGRHYAPKVE